MSDQHVVFRNAFGDELRANAHRFVSSSAGARYLGYLRGQKRGVSGERGTHTNRPELIDHY